MIRKNSEIFKPYNSKKTKYYGIIFLIIIAIPISIILYLFWREPSIFSAILAPIFLLTFSLLAYYTLSGKSMNYEVSDRELRINLNLLKKRIDYSRIVNVENVNLRLSLRLFGASLPGFHWGLFKTSIGNTHVYATKIKGEFTVITLNDGEKIALSPAEPTTFLKLMKEKTTATLPQNNIEINHQKSSIKRFVYAQVLAVSIAYFIFIGYFILVFASLPDIVPVHFGFDGVANRWADKSELLVLAGVAALFPIINAILSLKFGKYEKGLLIFLGIIFIAVLALFIAIVNIIAISV